MYVYIYTHTYRSTKPFWIQFSPTTTAYNSGRQCALTSPRTPSTSRYVSSSSCDTHVSSSGYDMRPNKSPDPIPLQQGDESLSMASEALGEIRRILKPGGIYVAVSHEKPELRLHTIRGSVFSTNCKVSHSMYDMDMSWHMYTVFK